MGDVWNTGAILLGVEIVVTNDHGAGVTRVKFFEQCAHGCLLRRRAGISRIAADVEPALVADA